MSAHSHDHAAVAPAEVLDPVCGMTISPDDVVGHVEHKGHTYYFCSQSCLDQFAADPERFMSSERTLEPATAADMEREYTCPMDPGGPPERPGGMSQVRDGPRTRGCRAAREDRVDLPNASRGRSRRSRVMPDLWDGARAASRHARGEES